MIAILIYSIIRNIPIIIGIVGMSIILPIVIPYFFIRNELIPEYEYFKGSKIKRYFKFLFKPTLYLMMLSIIMSFLLIAGINLSSRAGNKLYGWLGLFGLFVWGLVRINNGKK